MYDLALDTAKKWHGDQKRKYTGDPYWSHLVRVAGTVSKIPGRTIQMIQAALLHDTLEDTKYTKEDLFYEFGEEVGTMVVWLTNPPHSAGNRKVRKAMEVVKFNRASESVKTIKLADLFDNTVSIIQHDPSFSVVYLAEKIELLKSLQGGNHELFMAVSKQIIDAQDALIHG